MGALEDHAAKVVTSCLEPSLYVPVAMKPMPLPAMIEGVAGVTGMDESTALQVTVEVPEITPEVAVMTLVPPVMQFTASVTVNGPTVATDGVPEVQAAVAVMFCVELSENVAVAVMPTDCPTAIEGLCGVTTIAVIVGGGGRTPRQVKDVELLALP